MSQPTTDRRFRIALDRALAQWAEADPARCAALAGCTLTSDGVEVPYFGAVHLVTHPAGQVTFLGMGGGSAAPAGGKPAHPSVAIALLHYLLTADGTPPANRWITFRELPDGLFYSQAFAAHGEALLANKFGTDLAVFRSAAAALRGSPLDLADASFLFQVFPRLTMAVLVWEGDDEFSGQARVLFDANASHYLPTEDLSGVGDWLAHRLTR